jgi:cation:H+ antiporter
VALTALLTAVLLIGLLPRQRHGIGKVGWERTPIITLLVASYKVLYPMG